MHRRSLWWISALALVAVASLAAVTVSAPNLARTLEAQKRLAAERPSDAAVFNDLGNLLQLSHRPDEAEAAYRRAIELDPNRVSALFNLGLLQQEKGERREASKLYKRALKLEPRHAWAHYQLGSLYEAWGDESKAIDSYASSFALDPQLAFPEVNAQIVDNKLVTQSMLRAYRSDFRPTQAPTVYDDPRRIRPLLVRPIGKDGKEAATAPAAAAQAPAANPAAPRTGAVAGSATKDQAAGTVLRPQDLRGASASTGQALPPGSGARNPYAGGVRTTVPQPSQPTLREWSRPDPEGQQPSEEYSEEGIQQAPPQIAPTPPPGAYYRPGLPSTSRLNLELLPGKPRARALRGTR